MDGEEISDGAVRLKRVIKLYAGIDGVDVSAARFSF
jgi:hypothetical protein